MSDYFLENHDCLRWIKVIICTNCKNKSHPCLENKIALRETFYFIDTQSNLGLSDFNVGDAVFKVEILTVDMNEM